MFKTKKVNMNSLGEHLRELREKFGLSKKEVTQLTQVQPKYIEALEADDYDSLPADVYVKGFLVSLAKVYKTNSDKLINFYRHQKQIQENLAPDKTKDRVASIVPRFVFSSKTAALTAVAVVALLSFGYLFTQIHSLGQPPSLNILEPAEDGQVEQGLITIRGEVEAGSNVSINNQSIVVDASGSFVENISLAPGSNQIVFTAENKFGQETEKKRTIVFKEKAVAGSFTDGEEGQDEEEDSAVNSSDGLGVSLKISVAEEAAWVSVETQDRELFTGTMLPGSSRTFNSDETIMLTTGNAGATFVKVNGVDQGVLGEFGEVVRDREFTAEN